METKTKGKRGGAKRATSVEGSSRMRIREAAVYCGLSVGTLYNMVAPARAELPSYKIGRSVFVDKADLDALMNKCRRPSREEVAAMADYITRPSKITGNGSL